MFEKKLGQGNQMLIVTTSLKLHFQMFSVQTKTKTRRFQIPPTGSKSVFEKFRFRDRLEWKEGLSSDTSLRFQIPPT